MEIAEILPRAPLKPIVDEMAREWKRSGIKSFDDVLARPEDNPLIFTCVLTGSKVADGQGGVVIRNPNLKPVGETEGHTIEIRFVINMTELVTDVLAHIVEANIQDDGQAGPVQRSSNGTVDG